MFEYFPREVGTNRKIVYNKNEMLDYVNKNKKYRDMYTSVYSFETVKNGNVDYSSARLNKIFFDLDFKYGDAYEDLRKLKEYCETNDYKYTMLFSGGGFHFYIYTKFSDVGNKKKTLYNAHIKINKKLELDSSDDHVFGDISRIARIPNTYNFKREKYCVPITREDIDLLGEKVIELGEEKRGDIKCYCKGLLDLSEFKGEKIHKTKRDFEVSLDGFDDFFLIPCMKFVAEEENPSHIGRFALVTYLVDMICKGSNIKDKSFGEKKKIIDRIVDFISGLGWRDYDEGITRRQVSQIVNKGYYSPTCEWLRNKGLCVDEDCEYRIEI